jgi:predicted MFS family arabinose efflux permease
LIFHGNRLKPYTIYLLLSGVTAFAQYTIFTINGVYQVEIVKLNPLQLVLVGTMLESVAFVCQIPIDINNHQAIVRTLFAFNAFLIVSVIVFGLAGNFALALAAYWSASVCRKANVPLYMTWLTRNTDAKVRATVISMSGQVDAIGQIAGGPVIGLVGNIVSIRAAIAATGIILAPNLLLFARSMGQGKDTGVIVETEEESWPVATPLP